MQPLESKRGPYQEGRGLSAGASCDPAPLCPPNVPRMRSGYYGWGQPPLTSGRHTASSLPSLESLAGRGGASGQLSSSG